MKDSCPGSAEIKSPFPEHLVCIFCEHSNEIWSDETEIKCESCEKSIAREMKTTCLDWCPSAKECVGTEKYERLMKNK